MNEELTGTEAGLAKMLRGLPIAITIVKRDGAYLWTAYEKSGTGETFTDALQDALLYLFNVFLIQMQVREGATITGTMIPSITPPERLEAGLQLIDEEEEKPKVRPAATSRDLQAVETAIRLLTGNILALRTELLVIKAAVVKGEEREPKVWWKETPQEFAAGFSEEVQVHHSNPLMQEKEPEK